MRGYVLAVLAVAGATLAVELILIDREGDPLWWRIPLVDAVSGGAAGDPAGARARGLGARRGGRARCWSRRWSSASACGWRRSTAPSPPRGPTAIPVRGLRRGPVSLRVDRRLIRYLHAHGATTPYALFTQSADQASPLILLGLRACGRGWLQHNRSGAERRPAGHAAWPSTSALPARRRALRLARRQRRLDGGAARLPGDTGPDLVLRDQQRAWLLPGGLRRQGERAAPSLPLRPRSSSPGTKRGTRCCDATLSDRWPPMSARA